MNGNIRNTIYTKIEKLRKNEVNNLFKKRILKSIKDLDIPVVALTGVCNCTLDDIIYSLSYSNIWYIDKKILPDNVYIILLNLHRYLDDIEGMTGEEYYIWCLNQFVINSNILVKNMLNYPNNYGIHYDISSYLPLK